MGLLLHHAIEDSAARAPAHEAFRFDGATLSYQDLVERANRLAHLLIDQGARPHDRVGIFMPKSLDLPVAVYGILKAGAAYVPIDPAAPPARLAFILRDCGIRQVVTSSTRAARLAAVAAAAGLDAVIGTTAPAGADGATRFFPWSALGEASAAPPDVRVIDDDLAYVMYTSGSTGVPKGLMHTHASGRSYAVLSAREYGVRPDDRLGNHSPLHFDMSTFEYLTGPLAGATTVIIPEETTMFPRQVATLIEEERLTFWYSVPLALVQLLERGVIEERNHASLRWVLFGGEPFPPKHLARLAERWPHARFSNSYGPAEVNQCTAYHVPPGPVDPTEPVPLGHVWPGAEGRIVNERDQPVETGQVGELLIRSSTMMRGYWGRPDLTARALTRVPLAPGFDAVYYRTGDLVRQREDGRLVFLGRRDRQVKVRGYRVELEEVEAVITALPGVAEAAVVDVPGTDTVTIVAAVVADEGARLDVDGLKRGAAAALPAYAVPARFELRTTLPRTGSGKADRPALRAELASAAG